MTLRLFTLQAHYRKPLDFTAEALDAAATGWKGLNAALGLASNTRTDNTTGNTELPTLLAEARQQFIVAMDDDLNTSAALAVLFELAKPLRALANRLERGDTSAAAEAEAQPMRSRAALLLDLAWVLQHIHNPAMPRSRHSSSNAKRPRLQRISRRQIRSGLGC
jgi:cysteinyl-tRNA synthetase